MHETGRSRDPLKVVGCLGSSGYQTIEYGTLSTPVRAAEPAPEKRQPTPAPEKPASRVAGA
jgi:hypothetical protein